VTTLTVDFARLMALVVEEVRRAERRAVECACHATVADCCPDRLRSVVDAGAARLGLHAKGTAQAGLASFIDHTLLKPDATSQDIDRLCGEAAEHGFATVCVNPCWVARCADALQGTSVGVCSVVGFPLGTNTAVIKAAETRQALADGATEIDMVINVGALKSGDVACVEQDIAGVVAACRACGALSKVILEMAYLSETEKVTACILAKAAGADYVKTSTGFGPGGATVADVELMRRVVGPDMGVKAAGGVRDVAAAKAMIEAGATRVGASAGVQIVRAASQGGDAVPPHADTRPAGQY
jgi:deoxyribose-phosphate aldolase